MFNLGIQELAVIFIIALIFIGPKQLPELAKTLGKVFRDFKRASNEITDSIQREARHVTDFREEVKNDIKKDMDFQLLPETESVSQSSEIKPLDKKSDDSSDNNKA